MMCEGKCQKAQKQGNAGQRLGMMACDNNSMHKALEMLGYGITHVIIVVYMLLLSSPAFGCMLYLLSMILALPSLHLSTFQCTLVSLVSTVCQRIQKYDSRAELYLPCISRILASKCYKYCLLNTLSYCQIATKYSRNAI